MQAPSNQNVWYRRIQEIGLYLRSDDGGLTWHLPQYKIEGLSREEFTARHGGSRGYIPDIHLVSVDPGNPLRLYSGITLVPWSHLIFILTDQKDIELDGLYVSSDGGDSWTKWTDAVLNSAPIGISPSNPNIIYAESRKGVVKSVDGGKQWALVGEYEELSKRPLTVFDKNPENRRYAEKFEAEISEFAVDPKDENVVFIVSNKGVYRSMDGGKTWCLLNLGFDELGSAYSVAINAASTEEIFVGTSMGVFYSKNHGCHFQKIYPRQ